MMTSWPHNVNYNSPILPNEVKLKNCLLYKIFFNKMYWHNNIVHVNNLTTIFVWYYFLTTAFDM